MTDRGPNGKFVKGNKASSGRPSRATELEYAGVLKDTMPLDRFQRIVDKLAKKAEGGDLRCAELLLKYVLPNVAKVENTGANGGPILVQVEYVGNENERQDA